MSGGNGSGGSQKLSQVRFTEYRWREDNILHGEHLNVSQEESIDVNIQSGDGDVTFDHYSFKAPVLSWETGVIINCKTFFPSSKPTPSNKCINVPTCPSPLDGAGAPLRFRDSGL